MDKDSSKSVMGLEAQYSAQNYHPLPVVLSRGAGIYVYDVEGRKYFDFLSAYSAVNQGHGHARLLSALTGQAGRLTLSSRAFYTDALGPFAHFVTDHFGYDKVLPMNTGAEAVETALKIARRWGYQKKGVSDGQARIVVCAGNFHGRTSTIVSFSTDPVARAGFGPYMPGFDVVPYNDKKALSEALAAPDVVAFLVEPIQGEAGVIVPDDDYMQHAAAVCRNHKVLLIADEIQTGLCRTGSWLGVCGNCNCSNHCERSPKHYVRPDMLLLGKALGGGVYPVSAVLADEDIMEVITPGSHGSTFGGNPVGCRVAMAAIEILRDEHLMQNARARGAEFRRRMQHIVKQTPLLAKVRGRGLLNALVVNAPADSDVAWRLCLALKEAGLLAKPTHGNIIRLAPPLVISKDELQQACNCIEETTMAFAEQEAIV